MCVSLISSLFSFLHVRLPVNTGLKVSEMSTSRDTLCFSLGFHMHGHFAHTRPPYRNASPHLTVKISMYLPSSTPSSDALKYFQILSFYLSIKCNNLYKYKYPLIPVIFNERQVSDSKTAAIILNTDSGGVHQHENIVYITMTINVIIRHKGL